MMFHLKKLLLLIPLILVLSVVVFFMRTFVPQDPVEQSLGIYSQNEQDTGSYSNEEYEKEVVKLGLNKAKFYISIRPSYIPAAFDQLLIPREKSIARNLLAKGSNWMDIQDFLSLRRTSNQYSKLEKIANNLMEKGSTASTLEFLSEDQRALVVRLNEGTSNRLFFYPRIGWNGLDNQYHNWLTKFMYSSEVVSYIDRRPVKPKIGKALLWTLVISIISLLVSFVLGIALGVMQVSSQSKIWRILQSGFDIFYSMPVFWIATVMVVFFTTSDYGAWTNVFPSVHSFDFGSSTIRGQILDNLGNLILPILCISLHSIGYVSSIMATNLSEQLSKPFILTAKQKGLSNLETIRRHGIKNSMFPIITIFSAAIPGTLAGSLILEVIFNIPGIGRLIYKSILLADWNVVFPIIVIIAIVTMISYWLSDVVYEMIDPRIRMNRKS